MTLHAFSRLRGFTVPGSLGIHNDARFICCFWPHLDRPTRLFAAGSSGIRVMGQCRNVVFPDGVVFDRIVPDALYPAELAVRAMSPNRAGLVNLNDAEAAAWLAAYDDAVSKLPPTRAVHETNGTAMLLRHKHQGADYVALLSMPESLDLCDGKIEIGSLAEAKTFSKAADPLVTLDGSLLADEIRAKDAL
jgi:hypothetical protein